MLRILSFSLLLLALSCKSSGGSRSAGSSIPEIEFLPKESDTARAPIAVVNPEPAATPSPSAACRAEDAPVCPIEEANTPYRSVTLKYKGQLIPDHEQINAWANSPCQARLELYKAACAHNMNFAEIDLISSHPDANEGTCPAIFNECPSTQAPTRCFAEGYNDQELTWSSRPEAWGNNECDARNKLNKRACSLGLDPKDMKSIRCEAELSSLVCPPIWKNCVTQENEESECKLSKIGEINLKQPLSAIGASRCEATYRVQELACRFQKSEIKDFAGLQCQALNKQNAVQATDTSAPASPSGKSKEVKN